MSKLSSYRWVCWHLLPPLINKLYMKSIPSAPEGLLPPSLCPPSPLLSFHLSILCLRSILSSFFLLLWSWNHPLFSSLCHSPEREKFEPRESHELNRTLHHFLLPLPIPLAFLPSIFFYLSCLSSDHLVEHVTSTQLQWQMYVTVWTWHAKPAWTKGTGYMNSFQQQGKKKKKIWFRSTLAINRQPRTKPAGIYTHSKVAPNNPFFYCNMMRPKTECAQIHSHVARNATDLGGN